MAFLKFPLQDPPQQAASGNTATISIELICCHNRTDLLHVHSTFDRNCPTRSSSSKKGDDSNQRVVDINEPHEEHKDWIGDDLA